MTVGDKQYNEADMLRMQREAEVRVREMQERARRTVSSSGGASGTNGNLGAYRPSAGAPLRNRNWNSNSGSYRQRVGQQQRRGGSSPQRHAEPAPAPPHDAVPEDRPSAPPVQPEKKGGTLLGDIMTALNLDEDYLLIIGLILILINQKADTTLILALAYLLLPI